MTASRTVLYAGRLLAVLTVLGAAALVTAQGYSGSGVPDAPKVRKPIPRMVEEAQQRLESMRGALGSSFSELEDARKSQDVQRLGCVNEALTAIKGLVRLGEQNHMALREAAARGDHDGVEHEYVKLSLAATKVRDLSTRLKACAGPSVATETEGEAELEVLPDADLPSSTAEDPLSWYSNTEVVLQVPSSSSPFL